MSTIVQVDVPTYSRPWIRESGINGGTEDEEETILDMAESTLLKRIKEGDEQSAKWYLSKKGKMRGYGDSLAIEGGIQIVYADKDDERL